MTTLCCRVFWRFSLKLFPVGFLRNNSSSCVRSTHFHAQISTTCLSLATWYDFQQMNEVEILPTIKNADTINKLIEIERTIKISKMTSLHITQFICSSQSLISLTNLALPYNSLWVSFRMQTKDSLQLLSKK